MSVTLPYANAQWPFVRVLTAPRFALGVGPWTAQPMWSRNQVGIPIAGFELLILSRVALPAVGEATLRYRFGLIDGRFVGESSPASLARRLAGTPYDADDGDAIAAPDLRGYEIRIQLADAVAQGGTPAWRTEWWGQVEYQEDVGWPGSAYPAGERIYHCVDGFARTRRQKLNRHAAWMPTSGTPQLYPENSPDSLSSSNGCVGHPGYNVGPDGMTIGNRASTGATDGTAEYNPTKDMLAEVAAGAYHRHTSQGSTYARAWTDKEVIEHAVRVTRASGDPIFNILGYDGTADANSGIEWLSQGASPWPVAEGESAFDLVCRIAARQRGRGLLYVDWADDSAAPDGPLSVHLTVAPQVIANVTYTPPGGSATVLPGATTARSTVAVDVIGDHRALADAFQLGDADMARYDYVESYGERLEVLVTLSRYDVLSLENRWQTASATAFAALTTKARGEEAWRPIYQTYGLPRAWRFQVGDHNGGPMNRCDFRCDDTGTVGAPGASSNFDSNPMLVEIMPDLPLYEGYDYTTSSPTPKSGASTSANIPGRRPPFALIRTGTDLYLTGDEIARALDIYVHPDGIHIAHGEDTKNGTRVISDTTVSSLSALYDNSALGVTIGLRLPERVRMASYATGQTAGTARRRLTVYHQGIHLWLADIGAIWDLNTTARSAVKAPCAPRRACAGATPGLLHHGILRDDRAALAVLHALACSWYLTSRRTAQWGLKACGLLPSFATGDGLTASTATYPRLGQLVTGLKASGQEFTINTPITSVSYDHQSGQTMWATDWAELDFK